MSAHEPPLCSGCGRSPARDEPAWAWSREQRDDQLLILCPDCTREHTRSIEAKLDPEWW